MSELTDRLHAEWLRSNGSTAPGERRSLFYRERSERLRAEWLEDARNLAMRQRAEQRMRSARSRAPVAGNCESVALAICGTSLPVKSEKINDPS